MEIKDAVINVFEARIMQLITITDITKLPQWTDSDVIGAECLLKEYRNITSAMHSDGKTPLLPKCPFCRLDYYACECDYEKICRR